MPSGLNLITETAPIKIKTSEYKVIDPTIIEEPYGETDITNISNQLERIANMKYDKMTKYSVNPMRDVLKEILFPVVGTAVGSTAGVIAGLLLHKLHIT